MKKILTFGLATLLLLTGAACADKGSNTQQSPPSQNQESANKQVQNKSQNQEKSKQKESSDSRNLPGEVVEGKNIEGFHIMVNKERTKNKRVNFIKLAVTPATIDPSSEKFDFLNENHTNMVEGELTMQVMYGGKEVFNWQKTITKSDYQPSGIYSYIDVTLDEEQTKKISENSKEVDAPKTAAHKLKFSFTAKDGTKITKQNKIPEVDFVGEY